MATLSELIVELKLSADNFNNGLKQAQREAKEFEKDLKPTLEVTKNLGLAMTAAGGAIVAGLGAASKAAIDYGDALNDARQRTGASVETLSKLGFAAEQSGSSFQGLSNGLKFLSKNMEAAISKSGEQRAAFNELGISSKDLAKANGDVEKILLLVADKFKNLPDDTNKAALAMRVFGKSGADLIPLLNEGSSGIRKLGEDAQRAGLVIDQDFASASDQLNDTLNEVKASALGVSIGIAQALLPALQSAASAAAEAGSSFAAFSKEHPALIQGAAALGAGLLTLGTSLTALAVIVPKVQAGFVLLQAGVTALGGAMAVLSGVAIVALIAALASLYDAYRKNEEAQANLKNQLSELSTAEQKAAAELQKHGIQVRLEQIPIERRTETLAKLREEMLAKIRADKQATDTSKNLAKAIVDEAAEEKAREKAVKDAKEAQEKLNKEMAVALDVARKHDNSLTDLRAGLFDFNKALQRAADSEADAALEMATFTLTVDRAVASMEQARYNVQEMDKDFASLQKKDPGVHIAAGFEEADKSTKKLKSSFDDVQRTATRTFQEMFRDGEISFTKLGGVLRGVFETAASEILGTITAKLITPLVDKISGGISSALSHIPGLGGVFGGTASAASGAASAGRSVAGSAGSIAGGATGILGGVIGGGIAAAGSLLGSARLEGTLNAVEFNTRATRIQLADTMELILQPMKARLEDILAELYNHKYIPDLLQTIANRGIVGGSVSGTGGANSITINVYQNPGEDGYSFATRLMDQINNLVEHGGGRLIASGLKA